MAFRDRALGAMVRSNNEHIRAVEGDVPNPRRLDAFPWHRRLVAEAPAIRAEWRAFVDASGRVPRIEEVLGESQGNLGDWRFGLLVSRRHTTSMGERWFPSTVAALAAVEGLQAAMFSVLAPGTSLPEHCGPNAGVLRYHLGIDCGTDSSLTVGGTTVDYRDDAGVIFDDTEPHSARNVGTTERVTLFCEIARPLPGVTRWHNAVVQRIIRLDPRYRNAVETADEWYAARSPHTQR